MRSPDVLDAAVHQLRAALVAKVGAKPEAVFARRDLQLVTVQLDAAAAERLTEALDANRSHP